METKYIRINPDSPIGDDIEKVVRCLENGGVIIYPTDTVYGLGCDATNAKALEKVARLKNIKRQDAKFALVAFNLSNIAISAKVPPTILLFC